MQINGEIKNRQVRVVGEGYENVGVVSKERALELAEEAGVDLVEIAERDGISVCKIIDVSKYLYEQKKAKKLQQKNQKKSELKEIRVGCNIADHDLQIAANKTNTILDEGDKVKVSVIFKGRQQMFAMTQGPEVVKRFLAMCGNYNIIKPAKLEGYTYSLSIERGKAQRG